MADINSTLEYIHSVKWQGSKPGLGRTRQLLHFLGNPERSLKFVHVAGTNGKGSTCAYIASVLHQAGYKTGLYISPYITRFNERMQIDGSQIPDDELIELVEQIKPFADAMEDTPTEFEIITALAMLYFRNNGCDIVVLEVGMGGELDSTNVISTPELAVITAIDYDHVEFLGPTLRDIAKAKAGIIKEGGDVLIYGGSDEVEEVFKITAERQGARLRKADFSRIKDTRFTSLPVGADLVSARTQSIATKLTIAPYGEITLPLHGTYQPNNALVAITALEMLRDKGFAVSDDDIRTGIASVSWPGRFEILGREPVFVLDGAHNLHGVRAAVDSLQTYFGNRKNIFIVGVLKDKDVEGMAAVIAPGAEQVYAVQPDNPRAMPAGKLAEVFERLDVPAVACSSIEDGVQLALARADESSGNGGNGDGAVICALGSLYMSADIKKAFERASKQHSSKNT